MNRRRLLLVVAAAGAVAWLAVAAVWQLSLGMAGVQGARWLLTPVAALLHHGDLERAAQLAAVVHRGGLDSPDVLTRWHRAADVGLAVDTKFTPLWAPVPMVYATRDAPGYAELRARLGLSALVAAQADEFAAMLAVGRCVGTAWDHGLDAIAGGPTEFDPAEAIVLGRSGRRYHCAIAARTLVHCATAVGFVARTVTLAADGYTPQHTVCELWSNQFAKWFVLDADFNVVYLRGGVPASAFELCRHGPSWAAAGELEVRAFAPSKPSLPMRDLLPSYASLHLDLRTDWRTRQLPRGSPAGGDLATYYATRPDLGRLLTWRQFVADAATFDWPVNQVRLRSCDVQRDAAGARLRVELAAYAPQFDCFEWCLDAGEWQRLEGSTLSVALSPGAHRLEARVCTGTRWPGPISELTLRVDAIAPPR